MYYKEIQPPAILQHLVRFFWVLEYNGEIEHPVQYKLLAESFPGLVFFFNNQYGAINGQTTEHKTFSMSGKFKMMGVYLYPYALPLLFKTPSNELTHQHLPLDDFNRKEFSVLEERILSAPTDDLRVKILSDYLLQKTQKQNIPDDKFLRGIQYIIHTNSDMKIETLARQAGISNRQLERKFQTSVGFSPKVFLRLMRFQKTLRIAQSQTVRSLTDIAYAAGYFDQSHFIREFKEFAGFSPREYFSLPASCRADNFIQLHT
jgi:AraC-like DNA-binding protein